MRRFFLAVGLVLLPAAAAAQDPALPDSPLQSVPLPRPRPKIVLHLEPRSFAEAVAGLNFKSSDVTSAPSECQIGLDGVAIYEQLPRLIGPGECGGGDMVRMRSIFLKNNTSVTINPPLQLRCTMAFAFAGFVRDELTAVFGTRTLRSIDGTGSYECRGRNRIVGAKVSEHGKGNAIDIHSVQFTDGTALFPTDLLADKELRETLKTAACGRFSTVLGPGSDGYHEEHVHLDLAERRGTYKMCQWNVLVAAPSGVVTGIIPLPRPRPALTGADVEEETPPDKP